MRKAAGTPPRHRPVVTRLRRCSRFVSRGLRGPSSREWAHAVLIRARRPAVSEPRRRPGRGDCEAGHRPQGRMAAVITARHMAPTRAAWTPSAAPAPSDGPAGGLAARICNSLPRPLNKWSGVGPRRCRGRRRPRGPGSAPSPCERGEVSRGQGRNDALQRRRFLISISVRVQTR